MAKIYPFTRFSIKLRYHGKIILNYEKCDFSFVQMKKTEIDILQKEWENCWGFFVVVVFLLLFKIKRKTSFESHELFAAR